MAWDIPLWVEITLAVYFALNLIILGAVVNDELRTPADERQLTEWWFLQILFGGVFFYSLWIILLFILPAMFPDSFLVRDENIQEKGRRKRSLPYFPDDIPPGECIVIIFVCIVLLVDAAVFGSSICDC